MHIVFGTRGVKHERDLFVTTMQSQFFPWKRINLKTGKEEITLVQGALRPLEFWEYVFPEESLPDVLAMLEQDNKVNLKNALNQKTAIMLRQMLGLKKIPIMDLPERNRVIHLRGMALHPIGIKKDERTDAPWGYRQEML